MNDEETKVPVRVSVNEFKNWLSGVLDFQPDDWVPNAVQWEKIRNKIEQLEETKVEVMQVNSEPAPVNGPPGAGPRHPRPVGPHAQVDNLNQPAVQLPDPPKKKPSPITVKKTGNPQVIEGEGGTRIVDTGVVHELGMIDTSETEYESSFK